MSSRDARFGLLLLLSLAGAAIAAYLALFELGLVTTVWDPLFAGGSEQVLRWSATVALPVPDAVLGFLAYGTEAVLLVGARLADRPVSRWLTVALGVVATLMALTSVGLVAGAGVPGPRLVHALPRFGRSLLDDRTDRDP